MSTWSEVDQVLVEADDGGALAAALASIEENDGLALLGGADLMEWLGVDDASGDTGSTTVSNDCQGEDNGDKDASVSDTTTLNVKKKKRVWKNTQKEELLRLRETVKMLETKLERMKHSQTRSTATSSSTITTVGIWQGIADRQKKEREEAVRENARLRALLGDRIRTIKNLERTLVNGRRGPDEMLCLPDRRPRIAAGVNPLYDTTAEARMRQMVLQMYHEVDRIIADPRFQSVNHALPSRLEERSLDSLGRSQFEVITANVLPFDVDATAETLWAMWMQRSYGLMKTTRLHDHHATEDGVARIFEGVLQTKSENARVVTKNVVRRFVEADRVVMTAIALMQLVDLDGKPMDGVYTRAQVWNIVYPSTDAQGNSVTRRLMYRLITPQVFDASVDGCDENLRTLTRFILGNEVRKSDHLNQMLENRLLERFASVHVS